MTWSTIQVRQNLSKMHAPKEFVRRQALVCSSNRLHSPSKPGQATNRRVNSCLRRLIKLRTNHWKSMSLRFLTAGESHGPSLTAILDGMPAGLSITTEIIDKELARRQKGYGAGGRMKIEKDTAQILGGLMAGETTGGPIALLVQNDDHIKWKGRAIEPLTTPRPGHADLTGAVKYGYKDLRPALERASARETTMRVAVGAVCKHFLAQFGIVVGGYVAAIGEIQTDLGAMPYVERFRRAEESDVRCPVESSAQQMRDEIEKTIH